MSISERRDDGSYMDPFAPAGGKQDGSPSRRELLRMAAAAVAVIIARPATALGSTLRLGAERADRRGEPQSGTTTATYPSDSAGTYSYTQELPDDPFNGTYKFATTETLTSRTYSGDPIPTRTSRTFTLAYTLTATQSGTNRTVMRPTWSLPKETATVTTETFSSPICLGVLPPVAGARMQLPHIASWRELMSPTVRLSSG